MLIFLLVLMVAYLVSLVVALLRAEPGAHPAQAFAWPWTLAVEIVAAFRGPRPPG